MNGSEFAAKWANRLSGATTEITKGVQSVTEAPGVAAVRKQAKLVANWTAAVNSGKWAANTSKVTLDEWKSAMINKGINRIASGANEATGKMAQFGQKLMDYQNANLGAIYSMPDTNKAETKARMDKWFDTMSKFKNT